MEWKRCNAAGPSAGLHGTGASGFDGRHSETNAIQACLAALADRMFGVQMTHEFEHCVVVREHVAPKFVQASPTAFSEKAMQQRTAKSLADESGVDREREFPSLRGWIDMHARLGTDFDAGGRNIIGIRHDKCSGCFSVDVAQALRDFFAQLVHAKEEACADLLRCQAIECATQCCGVVRADRSQHQMASVMRDDGRTRR